MAKIRNAVQTKPVIAPLAPESLKHWLHEAAVHRVAGRYDQACPIYDSIEQSNPEADDAPYFLALMGLALGKPVRARERLERLTRRAPFQPLVWLGYAHALRELGEWRESITASRRVLELMPNDTSERFALANALEVAGDLDDAVAVLRSLYARADTRLDALVALTRIAPATISEADRAEMAAAAAAPASSPEFRVSLQLALGALLERQGLYDQAFEAFASGNRTKRQILTGELPAAERSAISPKVRARPPAEAERRDIEEISYLKSLFTADFIAEQQGRGHHLQAPVFVVGMPRSGSTLIEQILSSHPKVQGLGETPSLIETIENAFPLKFLSENPPDHFRKLANAYLAAMHDRGWTTSARFIDKMLDNYLYIGVIHLMFPRARILHAVRDPVDTCLAAFRQNFLSGHETSYDLADLGRHYVRYREMMDHWAQVLPGRVIDVDHEALVADPQARIRWLVTEACGLSWDPACLDFHRTKRAVRTASVIQVRQPIFTTSVQRWRRYEKHLDPLFEALGPYAPARS